MTDLSTRRRARITFTDISGQERSVPVGPEAPFVTVGYATDCTIRTDRTARATVSRRHAEFRYADGQFEIVDLFSCNGTYLNINGERKLVDRRAYLADNAEVWCGDFVLRFVEDDGISPDEMSTA